MTNYGGGHGRLRWAHNPTVGALDRKSTRLNSSHPSISYAVFCLKKKIEQGLQYNTVYHDEYLCVRSDPNRQRHGRYDRVFFFFNDPPPTEIYTLSLHDALPISNRSVSELFARDEEAGQQVSLPSSTLELPDRKSTRLNSSHPSISYAVFCL